MRRWRGAELVVWRGRGVRGIRGRRGSGAPVLTRFNAWMLRRYGERIVGEVARRVCEGELEAVFGGTARVERCALSPSMSLWRVNRYEFLADVRASVEVALGPEGGEEWGEDWADGEAAWRSGGREGGGQARRGAELWVTVSVCLDEGASLFVETVSAERPDRRGIRLDEWLIPIFSAEEVEDAAEAVWRTYDDAPPAQWREVDAWALAERMGLSVTGYPLADGGRMRSALYWRDSRVAVAGPDGGVWTAEVPADTIVINERLVPREAYALSVFHECFHSEYHFLFYRLQAMRCDALGTLPRIWRGRYRGRGGAEGPRGRNPLPLIEWQAKLGSRALAMPGRLVSPMLAKALEDAGDDHAGRAMEAAARSLAEAIGVPKCVMRARLLQLGYWQVRGALNWVRFGGESGGYIRPFMFSRESCPTSGHTFVISPGDALRLYLRNPAFRARIDSGRYVYVQGHICVSDPRYVEPGPRLTEWANRHVDLCCLRFVNVYAADEHYEFHLNRVNSDEAYNRHYIDFAARGDALTAGEAERRQSEIIGSMPKKPGEALRRLMALSGVTREGLAERALVSDSTVRRWRGEEYGFDEEAALRIIVGLSLPPWLSYWFLETAGVSLRYYGRHMVYRNVINCHYMDSLREVNDLIEQAGYERLRETE